MKHLSLPVARYSLLLLPLLLASLGRPAAQSAPDYEELVAWARPKVVLISVQTAGVPRWGTGFIAERGRVITNEHVVQGARGITVWANGAAYRARVAATDAPRDLAAVVLPEASLELKPLALAPDSRGRPGEAVVILASRAQINRGRGVVRVWPVPGSTWGHAWLRWPNGLLDFDLRLHARAVPGDSGSPVLRLRDGAVVGIIRGRTNPDASGRSASAWAVPVEAARALLDQLQVPSTTGRPAPERYYLEPLAGG